MIQPAFQWLKVALLSSGAELRLPLHRMEAPQPGPRLGILATSHGDEPLAIEILRRFVHKVPADLIRGSILVLPVENPPAFEAGTRNTPQDMLNMNRSFPGRPDGFLTEKMAHVISEHFFPRIDYLIDLHAGTSDFTVDYTYVLNDENLARAFGSPALIRGVVYPGSAVAYGAERGIPSILAELGGGAVRDEQYIQRGIQALYNVLRHLQMIPGRGKSAPAYIFDEIKIIFSPAGGLFCPRASLADLGRVHGPGKILGTIVSPYTFEVLEEIKTPFRRSYLLLLKGVISRIQAGDFVYIIGNMDRSQTVSPPGPEAYRKSLP